LGIKKGPSPGKDWVTAKIMNDKSIAQKQFMDKTFEQLLKAFNHLAREVQVYFISGLLIVINIFFVTSFRDNIPKWLSTDKWLFIFLLIFLSYILGHLCMGLYYVVFELEIYGKKKDGKKKSLNYFLGFKHKVDEDSLPVIYKTDPESYMHFIERDHILTMMRSTLTAAFLINFITDGIFFVSGHSIKCQVL
jgi:hypothetical protein